jgi:L-glutamine synthetase (EC 6.3.1.2)
MEKGADVEVNEVVTTIPKDMREALNVLDGDSSLKFSLGTELISSFLELKKRELESYENYVSEWEREAYLKAGW